MPRRNTERTFISGGFYHIYNRGVEKRTIYENYEDHSVFLSYLKQSLSKPNDKSLDKVTFTLQGVPFKGIPRQPKNYYNKIELHAYCLIPNHYHLLLRQAQDNQLQSFMNSVMTRYSMYFNKKYKRVGGLYQGQYRAVLVNSEEHLLHLSRYIHINPLEYTDNLESAYSSYAEYLGKRKTKWVKTDTILSFFDRATIPEINKVNSYKDFVENYKQDSGEILGKLTLED